MGADSAECKRVKDFSLYKGTDLLTKHFIIRSILPATVRLFSCYDASIGMIIIAIIIYIERVAISQQKHDVVTIDTSTLILLPEVGDQT